MTHEQAYELIHEYLFGALDAETHQAVEAHLDTECERCARLVRELGELSVDLAEALPQSAPPASLKAGLLNQISASAPTQKTASPAQPTKTTSLWPRVVAAVGIAASIALLFWINSLHQELKQTQDALAQSENRMNTLMQDESVQEAAQYLFGLPCTQMVPLNGVGPNEASFANVFLHPHEQFGVVYAYRMPPPPQGKAYQLWIELDGKPVSAGMFTVDEKGEAMVKLESFEDPFDIGTIRVTIEPAEGMPEPTGMMYLNGPNTMKHMDMDGSH